MQEFSLPEADLLSWHLDTAALAAVAGPVTQFDPQSLNVIAAEFFLISLSLLQFSV